MIGFAAEPKAIRNEIQTSSQLIDFKHFSNFHFPITRNNCDHISKYVEAADFQNTSGANRTYSYDSELRD